MAKKKDEEQKSKECELGKPIEGKDLKELILRLHKKAHRIHSERDPTLISGDYNGNPEDYSPEEEKEDYEGRAK